ncbi:hypothetical protein ACFWP3_40615 [Streptomyces sp. NPDC058525]|uniref:hypothetical protein n=1 Tax=Streptomyces sp. NPDC058525 TaxID=3346538 RepID=UPI0036620883
MKHDEELQQLSAFMLGPDNSTLGRMIGYFSVLGKYLHPRELKEFWETLQPVERAWFRHEMITWAETL